MLRGPRGRLVVLVRHPLRLLNDGRIDQFFACPGEVSPAGQLVDVEQAIHRLAVRLQSAVGVNVRDIDALFIQGAGDKEGAMAVEWLLPPRT